MGHLLKGTMIDWPKRCPAINEPTYCDMSKHKPFTAFKMLHLE